jgi:FtsP/CotA-like multicopper oxidase with cupredoxin domain
MHENMNNRRIPPISRRTFVQGLAIGGTMAAVSWGEPVFAETQARTPETLTGSNFELNIDELTVNVTGRRRIAVAVNGSVPGPTLRWREGDLVTLSVTNRLKVPTSIHWHGVRVPPEMDGVPGVSFPGIPPGERFVYRFPVRQSGTYWYHSHSGAQEQTGLSGALIIDPRDGETIAYDREYVIFLADWTDANPETIFGNLKQDSEYYNFHQRTAATFFSDVKTKGLGPTITNRRMWGRMNMTPTDISDVTGSTYTYLLNGNNPSANWTGLFNAGERVRLRFINGSAMTFFDVRIPGLTMTVVQSDGNDVEPVVVDEFRIGNAETYDVIVEPREEIAYSIFAQAFDRTGYARGTLAPRAGMTAEVPAMDPRPTRTMVDMGMAMSSMKGMKMPDANSSAGAPKAMPNMPGMKMGEQMPGMGEMGTGGSHKPAMTEMGEKGHDSSMQTRSKMVMGNETGTTPFPQPGPHTMPLHHRPSAGEIVRVKAAHLRIGPQIDNLSMAVSERLADPGDGLQRNGRRVLSYSDLRARYRGVDGRFPTREIELHLTGNMQRYIWGFDGKKFTDAGPIELKLGERVRFILINDSMMDHPIHLHGLWSEVETGHGEFNPYKHTVIVKPSERVNYLVSADTVGRWAFHCHLMYHMQAGMFRTVVVS